MLRRSSMQFKCFSRCLSFSTMGFCGVNFPFPSMSSLAVTSPFV